MQKTTVEDTTTIHAWEYEQDVKADLRAAGVYERIERDAHTHGSVALPTAHNYTLSWRPRRGDRPHQQQLRYVATPCHFGGFRLWFTCYARADEPGSYYGCRERVGTLYRPPGGTWYLCRECWDLTYECRQHDTKLERALVTPFVAERRAREKIKEEPSAKVHWRELYTAKQAIRAGHLTLADHFGWDDQALPAPGREPLPPFEHWFDQQVSQPVYGHLRGRPYGRYGRCTATAKSTGERCRQPAIGEHEKCYYHGGAPGSGIGEGQRDHAQERLDALIEQIEEERRERAARTEALFEQIDEER